MKETNGMTSAQRGILSGYRVVDCSVAMAGPMAAQRLGDMGADVIKVEPPTGEWQRQMSNAGLQGKRINVAFRSLNRNKRSLAVDLKSSAGRDLVYELVRTADVFLQNYRPGVADRLGLAYEQLRPLKPDLVYVSMSGYGETGPYAKLPGQDLLLQAMSGAMLSTGPEGSPPMPAGQFLVDAVAAHSACEGAVAALLHRERTGEGQKVEVNMLDVIVTLQMQELSLFLAGAEQKRSEQPHAHSFIRAPYGVFETSDGYLALAFPNMRTLGEVLGEDFFLPMEDEVHTHIHRDEIFARCRAHLLKRTTAEWIGLMRPRGIWCGPVYGYKDVVADPQIRHNGTIVEYDHPTEGRVRTPGFPIRFTGTPCSIERGAPLVGEHTSEILSEIGLDAAEIARLKAERVIAETSREE
jgi:crotonobetainyl-CoA:carnitine CoA-transferase CaiB-like acyl-CoA transferase